MPLNPDGAQIGLAIIGFVAGVCGGLLGIGGSIVMIPAMTELMGPQQHLYQAAALTVNFFVAAPAVVQHVRAKAIRPELLKRLVPAAMLFSVVGVLCSELSLFRGERTVYLTALFGVFMLFVAAREALSLWRRPTVGSEEHGDCVSASRAALLVGLPTGFVSGLLGVGGGLVAVPLLRKVMKLDVRSAIANSAATIVALSLVGTVVKHVAIVRNHTDYAWTDPLRIAVWLIPTAIFGALIGGRLTHVLPVRTVRAAFVVLLVVAGVRMMSRSI